MADPKGFLKHRRETAPTRPIEERLKDFREIELRLPDDVIERQGSRCMDCGVPFCHYACPVANVIPDWNDLVFHGQWKKAVEVLEASNNFPEFTGRVCPALCEASCVLGINDDPITIRQNEISIVERGFREGVIKPYVAKKKTGKKVAVVGSGPAGLAAAQQLTRAGHAVILFEADQEAGGILRYGIPDFKLEKRIIDRRLNLMQKEGLKIETGVCVGQDLSAKDLLSQFDVVCLAMGSRQPRDLEIEGRDLNGIHFAMDYLIASNEIVTSRTSKKEPSISAKNKNVLVIGGGDTGADCVGVANRQGAKSVTQIELLAKPPLCRTQEMPWPTYPKILKTSSSHQEGCKRLWSVLTRQFKGKAGCVTGADVVTVEFHPPKNKGGRPVMRAVSGAEAFIKADLVILAMGFVHPVHKGLVADLGLELTPQGNIRADQSMQTSLPKVFAAGDAQRGASLVVWAINDGRVAAREIDRFLMGSTNLP